MSSFTSFTTDQLSSLVAAVVNATLTVQQPPAAALLLLGFLPLLKPLLISLLLPLRRRQRRLLRRFLWRFLRLQVLPPCLSFYSPGLRYDSYSPG